jgi:oxaloacetate decarboxylase alpha subunit
MTTAMMLPIAPVIDEVGYHRVDVVIAFAAENTFERQRLMVKAMPNTKVGAGTMGRTLAGFRIVPDSLIALFLKCTAANGIKLMTFLEPLCNWKSIIKTVEVAKKIGMEVCIPLPYAISPVHTDAYYVEKAAEAIKLLKPARFYVKDSMGLLTPERVRTLVPEILKTINGIPLELHSHCNTGLAPLCYLEAVKLGINTLHTCVRPLANGNSLPSAENTIRNLRVLGYTPMVNEKAIEAVSAHFTFVAKRENFPMGVPVEYDAFQPTHAIAGGTISHLQSMLAKRGMEDRWEEVVEEICRMVEEWGYPPNITPYSQIMNAQAVLNITLGERYDVAPEETIRYLLGHFGEPPGPIDQNIVDKVSSLPEAKPFLNWEQPQPSEEDLRKEFGYPGISDEELVLRGLFPKDKVDAMFATGPVEPYPRGDKPVMALIQELTKRKGMTYIHVQKKGFSLTQWKGHHRPGA